MPPHCSNSCIHTHDSSTMETMERLQCTEFANIIELVRWPNLSSRCQGHGMCVAVCPSLSVFCTAQALLTLLQVRPSACAFTIPTASKEPHTRRYGPGPGEYAPPPPRPGPAFSIAPRHTAPSAAGDVPGPGEYEATELPPAPAFSLASRAAQPLADATTGAGPADYYLPSAFPGGPAFSVPQATIPEEPAAAHPTPGAPHLL